MRVREDRRPAHAGIELGRDHFAAEPLSHRSGRVDVADWQGRPLADALRAEDLKLDGSWAAARRFAKLFPPPQPAVQLP